MNKVIVITFVAVMTFLAVAFNQATETSLQANIESYVVAQQGGR